MRKNCENCGKEFNAKRATAKYCSTNCRVKASAPKPKVVDEHKAKVYDREKNLQKFIKLIGLALTGSFKGFEVLNEV